MTRRPLLTILIALTALLVAAATAHAFSLVRDTTLGGGNGVTIVPVSKPDEFETIAAVRTFPGSSKFLVVTNVGAFNADDDSVLTCQHIVVRRFNQDGSLDATYGRAGEFRHRTTGRATCANNAGVRRGGQITVTATILRGKTKKTRSRERVVFQLDGAGRLNRSFGSNGFKRFGSGSWAPYVVSNKAVDTGRNLAFAYWRRGAIETVITAPNGRVKRVRRSREGSVCTLGSDSSGRILSACVDERPRAGVRQQLVVRRWNSDGSTDRGYGRNGRAVMHSVTAKKRSLAIDGFYAGADGNSYIEWQVIEENGSYAAKISAAGEHRRVRYRIGNAGLAAPRSGASGLATVDSDVEGQPDDGQFWMDYRVFDRKFDVMDGGVFADGTKMLIADFASTYPSAVFLVGTLARKVEGLPFDHEDRRTHQLAIQRFSIVRPTP